VYFSCWPYGTTTSDLARPTPEPLNVQYTPAPVMMRMEMAGAMEADSIVVTAQKRMAEQEDLGDLKLYRVPFPVTVAARAQKQVAFLKKQAVPGELIYRSKVSGGDYEEVEMLFRVQNKKEFGLGDALPAGKIAFFQSAAGRRMLVGETSITDKAVGEEVEFTLANTSNVSVDVEEKERNNKSERYVITVSNANPFPITFEAEFSADTYSRHDKFTGKMIRKKGKTIWSVIIGPNSEMELGYRKTDIEAENQ
jgi:hypothetical protein